MTNKVRINITIDPTLLDRIDAVCESRNEARSAWFERIASRAIEDEEQFIQDMENPLVRGVARALVSHPIVLKAMAMAVAAGLTPEEEQRMLEKLPEQLNRGAARAARKKGKKS